MKSFHLSVNKEVLKPSNKGFRPNEAAESKHQKSIAIYNAYAHSYNLFLEEEAAENHTIIVSDYANNLYQVDVSDLSFHYVSCSCFDFFFNRLNTCVHIEAVRRGIKEVPDCRRCFSINKRVEPIAFYNPLTQIIQAAGKWTAEHLEPFGLIIKDRKTGQLEISSLETLLRVCQDNPSHICSSIRYHLVHNLYAKHRHQEKLKKLQAIDLLQIEPLKKPLFSFQRVGVNHLLTNKRAILADQMGLGKTFQALASTEILLKENDISRVLIISPASVKHQWTSEITASTDHSFIIFHKSKDVEKWIKNPTSDSYVVVNYELVQRNIELFKSIKFDVIIIDEAQRIRNFETKTWQAIKQLKSDFLFLLSGTLVENKLDDLFSIMEVIDPEVLGPKWKFDLEHKAFDSLGKFLGYRDLKSLRNRVASKILRRLKKDVLKELPDLTETTNYVHLTPEQAYLELHYREEAQVLLAKSGVRELTFIEKKILQQLLLKARQACNAAELCTKEAKTPGSPKLDEFENIIEEICGGDPDAKILVFSEWVEMLNLASKRLDKLGIEYVSFNGSIPTIKRQQLINSFKTDPKKKVFLSSDAGGEGLNLQEANHVIHLELPWNPSRLDQRSSRAHRINQHKNVQVTYLVSSSGIERGIEGVLRMKRNVRGATLDVESETDRVDFESFTKALEKATGC